MSEGSRQRFIQQSAEAGVDGGGLVEAARRALVAAIRWGLAVGIAVALTAVWRARAIPRIMLAKR